MPQLRSTTARSKVATIETTIEPKHPNRLEYRPIMSRRHATERVLAAAALLDSSDQAPMFSYSVHLGSNQRLGAIRPHAS